MTLKEKIANYLESKEKDFETGLKYYGMASHQRNILLYLQRKKDAAKLEYELKRCSNSWLTGLGRYSFRMKLLSK